MVTLSALNGAKIYRVNRDDIYIQSLLKFVKFFHEEYCLKNNEPEINFYKSWPEQNYSELFENTKRIALNSELIAFIPQDQVQRNHDNNRFFV